MMMMNAKSSLYIYIRYIWFGLVGFYGISTIVGYLMPKSSLYIYIRYIWFGLVGFYGISTIVGYLMPNPFYTYTLDIYDLFGWVLWHINHCRLFNAKSFLYMYIKYIWFGLVGFYGISTIVGYLMPNPFYTYTLDIYDLFGWVLWHINHCRLFNAKSFLYIYIKYIWFGLVGFYGISTIIIYLMANPLYTYISNTFVKKQFVSNILNKTGLIYLYTVKGFQVLLNNTNNLASVICLD